MMSPISILNKGYSMVVNHKSQRYLASSSSEVSNSLEAAAFFSYKGGTSSNYKGKGVAIGTHSSHNKGNIFLGSSSSGGSSGSNENYVGKIISANNYKTQKKGLVVCEFCGYNGHTKKNC